MSSQQASLVRRRLSRRKSMRRPNGKTGLSGSSRADKPSANMAPNPREEGLGRRVGSLDLLGMLLIPKDPRGIVLACGFVAVAALALAALVGGDWVGFAYLVAAGLGYFFLQTRLVPATVWLAVGAAGVLGATAGDSADWIVVALAGVLAVISVLPPAVSDAAETSGKLELQAGSAEFELVPARPTAGETSRKPEVRLPESANGDRAIEEARSSRQDISPRNGQLAALESALVAAGSPNRVRLRTFGSLAIELDGRDQARRLRDQPRLEFLLSCLIARAVWTPGAVDRSLIAEEMAPDISPVSQRDRLRKTLHALQSALGTGVKTLVQVTATQVRLDLAGVDVDFVALSDMSARVSRRQGLIDASLAEEVSRLLEATAGEFLSSFEQLEHQVTGGRSNTGPVVRQARVAIAGWRADLTAALARHLEASGRPQASIAYLRSALAQSQEREDLARLLVAAYMQTGQTARADEVRLEYGLSQGEVR